MIHINLLTRITFIGLCYITIIAFTRLLKASVLSEEKPNLKKTAREMSEVFVISVAITALFSTAAYIAVHDLDWLLNLA